MFLLSIILIDRENPIVLYFDKRETAEAVKRDDFFATVADDYGASVTVNPDNITALLVNDMAKIFKAQGQAGLLQAKAQAEVNLEAAKSPLLGRFGGAANRGGLIS